MSTRTVERTITQVETPTWKNEDAQDRVTSLIYQAHGLQTNHRTVSPLHYAGNIATYRVTFRDSDATIVSSFYVRVKPKEGYALVEMNVDRPRTSVTDEQNSLPGLAGY